MSVSAPSPLRAHRWRVVFALFAIAAVSFLDRNNISIAASAIQRDFGLSNVALGFVFSALSPVMRWRNLWRGGWPICLARAGLSRWA